MSSIINQASKTKIEENKTDIKRKIRETKQKIIDHLEQLEDALLKQVEEIFTRNDVLPIKEEKT